jgi:hypothetical protein
MIDQSFIDEFRADQKELVKDLSRDITLGYGSATEANCPNCTYDFVSGGSGASFTNFSGTITLFSGTAYERTYEAKSFKQKCPVCGGVGYLSVPNETIIKAHVFWEIERKGTRVNSPAGWSGQTSVKIKTDSKYHSDFLQAKYFIVDGIRVVPSSTPLIRSMGTADGIIELWCETE